jgi:hypothetical protein
MSVDAWEVANYEYMLATITMVRGKGQVLCFVQLWYHIGVYEQSTTQTVAEVKKAGNEQKQSLAGNNHLSLEPCFP